MTRVIWRVGEPRTARFARNWLHAQWLGFALGWPAHSVTTVSMRLDPNAPASPAREYAVVFEQILR